jgi:sugar phosphate isomerase/epimerase
VNTFSDQIVCCYLYPITKYGYPPDAPGTLRYMKEMAGLGFRSLELEGIRSSHLREVNAMQDEISQFAKSGELSIPYFCAVLPGLSSYDDEIRRENLELFELGCQTASKTGSIGILDNGPLPPFIFPDDIPVARHYDEDILQKAQLPPRFKWDRYLDALVDTYRTACRMAARYHLTYQLHPCLGVLTSTTAGFLRFADLVQEDNLRFNFDTANLFAMRENLLISLHQVIDRVDYIHISDNWGNRIEHLPVGEGVIEWNSLFKFLRDSEYQGHFGVDVGGAETEIESLNEAYIRTATAISEYLKTS